MMKIFGFVSLALTVIAVDWLPAQTPKGATVDAPVMLC